MKTRVLFVCTGNRARSQMAEGFLRHFAGDRFEVQSGGTEPKGLAEHTVQAMREIGIDVSEQRSNHVDEFLTEPFDYVITVCDSARRVCPVFPGEGKRLHWDIEDPADAVERGMDLSAAFRSARDQIKLRIEEFVREA